MITLSQVLYKNQINFKDFMYKVCKEFYTMVPVTIFFPKNSYLVENFNKKLSDFSAAGLFGFWASAHTDMKYLDFKPSNTGPKQLTVNHLSGTIQILFGGLLLASILFVFEIFWVKMQNLKMIIYRKK